MPYGKSRDRLFPEFFNGEEYHAIVREHGLDEDSVAKLKVPPLPA